MGLKSLEMEVPRIKALFIAYNCIHLPVCESDLGFFIGLHRKKYTVTNTLSLNDVFSAP